MKHQQKKLAIRIVLLYLFLILLAFTPSTDWASFLATWVLLLVGFPWSVLIRSATESMYATVALAPLINILLIVGIVRLYIIFRNTKGNKNIDSGRLSNRYIEKKSHITKWGIYVVIAGALIRCVFMPTYDIDVEGVIGKSVVFKRNMIVVDRAVNGAFEQKIGVNRLIDEEEFSDVFCVSSSHPDGDPCTPIDKEKIFVIKKILCVNETGIGFLFRSTITAIILEADNELFYSLLASLKREDYLDVSPSALEKLKKYDFEC